MLEGQTHSNEGEQQDTLTDVEELLDETLTQLRQLQRQHLTPERWRELKSMLQTPITHCMDRMMLSASRPRCLGEKMEEVLNMIKDLEAGAKDALPTRQRLKHMAQEQKRQRKKRQEEHKLCFKSPQEVIKWCEKNHPVAS